MLLTDPGDSQLVRGRVVCPGVLIVGRRLTAHVVLLRGEHGTEVARRVAERLATEHGLDHVTIQPEAPPPDDVVAVRSSRDGAVIRGQK